MPDERKQETCNVEVVVRCRPLNKTEKSEGTPAVISVTSKTDVCVRQTVGKKRMDKKYGFDRAFGQYATQKEVFSSVVQPIIDEVLEGFNCTVFAYGQTGTGKTHTMEGNMDDEEGAGIIPRAVKAVFKHLEDTGAEHSVRLSFLELYNEQLEDLLAKEGSATRLRIVEDARRGVVCNGLEEVLVHNLPEVQKAIHSAISKRKVAETLMNKASSRSHCIFTLTIHKKETTPDGEDLLKVGKLNLVDLAGSECVGRSGAKNKRAREAGNINQSLLTLGRVITALVEHRGHVPYRDSKLTRLLQESLGGRAKTCIIATLSPSVLCVEETLSTLDYAHRAKNIKNKPKVNQKMTKRVLLREYSLNIERLKAELEATREKNGVYLPLERYQEMEMNLAGRSGQIQELEGVLQSRQEELKTLATTLNATKAELEAARDEAARTVAQLEATQAELGTTRADLHTTRTELGETVAVLEGTTTKEAVLRSEAGGVLESLRGAAGDVAGLWAKVERKAAVEAANRALVDGLDADMGSSFGQLKDHVCGFRDEQVARMTATAASVRAFLTRQQEDHLAVLAQTQRLQAAATAFQTASVDAAERTKDARCDAWRAVRGTSEQRGAAVTQRSAQGVEQVTQAVAAIQQRLAASAAAVAALSTAVGEMVETAAGATSAFAAAVCTRVEALQTATAAQLAGAAQGVQQQKAAMASFEQAAQGARQQRADAFMEKMQSMMAEFVAGEQASVSDAVSGFQAGLDSTRSSLDTTDALVSRHASELADHATTWSARHSATQTAAAADVAQQATGVVASLDDVSHGMKADLSTVATDAHAAIDADVVAWQAAVAEAAAADEGAAEATAQAAVEAVAAHTLAQAAQVEVIVGQTKTAMEATQEHGANQNTVHEAAVASLREEVEFVDTWTQENCGVITTFSRAHFRTDQPTGATPAKRQVAAPAGFVSPPNRERLLARYRHATLAASGVVSSPAARAPVSRIVDLSAADADADADADVEANPSTAAVEAEAGVGVGAEAPAAAEGGIDADAVADVADVAVELAASSVDGEETPASAGEASEPPVDAASSAASTAAEVEGAGDQGDAPPADADAAAAAAAAAADSEAQADAAKPTHRRGRSRIPKGPAGKRGASRGKSRGRSVSSRRSAASTTRSRSRSRIGKTSTAQKASGAAEGGVPTAGGKKKVATRRSSRRRAALDPLDDSTNVA